MDPTQPRGLHLLPWRQAAIGAGVAVLAYGGLPSLTPAEFAPSEGLLVLGVLLGLVVGVACRLDPRAVPVVAAVASVTTIVRFGAGAESVPATVAIGLLIGAEVWVATWLLHRTGAAQLGQPSDVFWMLLVAAGVGLAAGLLAAGVYTIVDGTNADFLAVTREWMTDDVAGLMIVAPALLTLRSPREWNWARAPEFAAAAAMSLASVVYAFRIVDPLAPGVLGWPYLVAVGPLWAAIRLGRAAVAPIIAVTFWLAVVSTVGGGSSFAQVGAGASERLLTVQVFVVTTGVVVLVLAVLRDERRRFVERLHESSRLLHDIVDGTESTVFAKDYRGAGEAGGRYVMGNRAWRALLRSSDGEGLGRTDRDLFPPGFAAEFVKGDHEVLTSNESRVFEERGQAPDGRPLHFATAKFPLRDADGAPWGVGAFSADVTELVESRLREQRQAALLRAVFESSPTPAVRVVVGEPGSAQVVDANAAMCRLMGVPEGDFRACGLVENVHPDDRATLEDVLAIARSGPGAATELPPAQRELRITTADGRTVWVLVSAGAVEGPDREQDPELAVDEVVVQLEDYTVRREVERALAHQALRDPITGLPNRRALHERLDGALSRLRRKEGTVTVLFCDLDRFKDVNDSLGHHAGDQMLVEVAARLLSGMRPEDTLARIGGDEFVAFAEGVASTDDARQIARRMQERLSTPWSQQGAVFTPAMSVGIAATSDADVSTDELLRRADIAMYRAKDRGRNRIEVYDQSLDDRVQESVAIQRDLRAALETDGLIVHYQPMVALSDRSAYGAEALVRLPGRDGTLIPPMRFVPEAEVTGLVVPMGVWVLDQALAAVCAWRARGFELAVAVNVSPAQLVDGFAAHVLGALESQGAEPAWLCLEVTETALIHEPIRTGRELTALNRAGVAVALDDFGTGYSSLSWLARFPVTSVKIDHSFVADLGIDRRKEAIVRAVIEVSHDLDLVVVAEGVETEEQCQRLVDLGCDRAQGYYFGRPAPFNEAAWSQG